MRAVVMSFIALMLSVATASSAFAEPQFIYWTDDLWKIRRTTPDGAVVEPVITYPTTSGTPRGIALDVARNHIYYTLIHGGIRRASVLDPQNTIEELLIQGTETKSTAIALDLVNNMIYWAEFVTVGTSTINRAPLDFSAPPQIVVSGLGIPLGLALDVTNQKIYWTDEATKKIQRAKANGSINQDLQDVIVSGLNLPHALALDVAGNKLYWSDFGNGQIRSTNLNDWSVNSLVVGGLSGPFAIALDLDSSTIYWVERHAGIIRRANLNETPSPTPQPVVSTGPFAGHLALYPQTPTALLDTLVNQVVALNLKVGIANSLDAKLDAALNALDDMNAQNNVAAVNSLQAFINAVQAQSGNNITQADALALIAAAQAIIDAIQNGG